MTTDQPTNSKSKLRWYQFSLRTLLIIVTLFAVACSWFAVKMQQARRQKEAVETLMKLGGSVEYDYERDSPGGLVSGGSLIEKDSPGRPRIGAKQPGPTWLRKVLGDDFIRNVSSVSFYGDKVTNADLEHLEGLKQLKYLALLQTQVTDAGLEHLKGLNQLQRLYLGGTKITDAGLEHLKGLTQIQELDLSFSQITDSGLEHLKGLTQLSTLSLLQTKITDAGLVHLKVLTRLGRLDLMNTSVTDDGVQDLQKALPKLKIKR